MHASAAVREWTLESNLSQLAGLVYPVNATDGLPLLEFENTSASSDHLTTLFALSILRN
jgi:hypothetical protein